MHTHHPVQHDIILVIAALAMCTFACVTARAMVLRARASEDGQTKVLWLAGAGSVAGAGVWATHFVAMLAYQTGLPLHFEVWLTLASILIAIALPAVAGALSYTRAGGAVSGIVFGAGVVAMHYVGMAAMKLPATFIWDDRLVSLSIVIGLALGGLAGHVSALPENKVTNVVSTGLRIATIIGAHFTAMSAFTIVPTAQAVEAHQWDISPTMISALVMAAGAFVVGQALILALVDRHLKSKAGRDAARMRAYIAELEETRSRLEKASIEAEAASKSKSAFLASMSHELRTPLNAVIGFSETIMQETLGPIGVPKYKEYLTNVHDSGKHLLALINDILDIAKFDAGHGELEETVFDPCAKVRDVARMMSGQAYSARVNLVLNLPDACPFVSGDRRRIRQVLLNLISNALKFTQPEGTVTVKLWLSEGLRIRVTDTGIGMAQQDFSKALEPFGQVDSSLARKYEGSGLGLPISRQLIELHGGTLDLESKLGVGTTVTVCLPSWRIVGFEGEQAA